MRLIPPLLAGAAVLLAVAASSGAAQGSRYSLKLAVCPPCNASSETRSTGGTPFIGLSHRFPVQVTGTSNSTTQVSVFLTGRACKASAKLETGSFSRRVLLTTVAHTYKKATKPTAEGNGGLYNACAYLTSGSGTLAHARQSYAVLVGGY